MYFRWNLKLKENVWRSLFCRIWYDLNLKRGALRRINFFSKCPLIATATQIKSENWWGGQSLPGTHFILLAFGGKIGELERRKSLYDKSRRVLTSFYDCFSTRVKANKILCVCRNWHVLCKNNLFLPWISHNPQSPPATCQSKDFIYMTYIQKLITHIFAFYIAACAVFFMETWPVASKSTGFPD